MSKKKPLDRLPKDRPLFRIEYRAPLPDPPSNIYCLWYWALLIPQRVNLWIVR